MIKKLQNKLENGFWIGEKMCILHYFSFYSFLISLYRNESESGEEEEEIPLLSEEEMNKLGSKLIKAEIMGNTVSWVFISLKYSEKLSKQLFLKAKRNFMYAWSCNDAQTFIF